MASVGTNGIDTSKSFHTEVLIIGGGFSGCYALARFKKLNYQVKLVEAGGGYGGTWWWNRYPGARVDSEVPLYQLAIPEVWKTWTFSERFPGHEEIRKYFNHCADTLNLREDTLFNVVVEGVQWGDGKWTCNTRDGRVITCKYLILCTGSSYKKYYPSFEGLDKFKGQLIHSAAFPEGGLDYKGKRVAVIGQGATGVQIVQEVSKQDCDMKVFIRTPNIALPMQQRKLTKIEQENGKGFYDALFISGRTSFSGFPYNAKAGSIWDATDEEREAHFEDLWQRGGFSFLISNWRDFSADKKANALHYNFWAKKVRERIKDPVKRDIMAPLDQTHYLGTKRPSLEQDYYECIDRPNVELVNLKKENITEFTERGIRTDKQEFEFDIIILATGYDFLTGSLIDLKIKDTEGKTIEEKWSKGVMTYLGLMVPKMPNAFLSYSPQAPTSLSNGPPTIEIQIDWIVDAIEKMKAEGIDQIDPEDNRATQWRQDIQDMNAHTLFPEENSWYMGANIPGKPREQLIYIGGVGTYETICRDALKNWDGFKLAKASA